MDYPELFTICQALKSLRREREAIERKEEELTDSIKAHMAEIGDFDLQVGPHHVTWKKYEQSRLDSKSLKRDHAELYQQYQMVVECQRFTLK